MERRTYATPGHEPENVQADLWMKVGTTWSYCRAERVQNDAAPIRKEGKILVPVCAVAAFAGKDVPAEAVTESGIPYMEGAAIAEAFGLHYYEQTGMGLVAFSENELCYDDTYPSLCKQCDVIFAFAFDFPTPEKILDDFRAKTGIGRHPFLLANKKRFDTLRGIAASEDENDAKMKGWIESIIAQANEVCERLFEEKEDGTLAFRDDEEVLKIIRDPYFCYDENGDPIVKRDAAGLVLPVLEYTSEDGSYHSECTMGDGVDVGIRLTESVRFCVNVTPLSFAYQITGEKKYAEGVYLIIEQLGKWPTWGEGHFLNCADTAVTLSIAFDWVYHAFDDEPEKLKVMSKSIYDKAVVPGFYSTKSVRELIGDEECVRHLAVAKRAWGRRGCDTFFWRNNNWNPVCTSGITVACLAVLHEPKYRDVCAYTISDLLTTLPTSLYCYAPDGSYNEGAGYWGYGTLTFIKLAAALESACGDDYGMLDAGGMDSTFYFPFHIANGIGKPWNFHDGNTNPLSFNWHYYAAKTFGNPDFAYMRDRLLDAGMKPALEDILYYDPKSTEGANEPSLDRWLLGSEIATMRSGWEREASFLGLHAGANLVPHSDMDSGAVMYESNGVRWLWDYGSENYNCGGYWDEATRYPLYRKSPEGHTTISIRSEELPLGQVKTRPEGDYAKITSLVSEDDRAVAVADLTPSLGSTCESARRAAMLVGGRKDAVIRDEITFSAPTSLTWCAILCNEATDIAEDGRSAVARYGKARLAITLLSDDENLKLSMIPAGTDPFLSGVVSKNSPKNKDENGEYIRPLIGDTTARLAIVADNVTSFNVAVVLQPYTEDEEKPALSYEFAPIA